MSGVAGGTRIQKTDIQRTFDEYRRKVLERIPGFRKASLTGSVKVGTKPDYGDLDLITLFEGDDKKLVKQMIIKIVNSLPDNLIVPFKSEKYIGRKYYNSGEIITVLFPIEGKTNEYIQVDNIIALTEEEHMFKNSFLDLPAEKQGLILGLIKVILLEKNPKKIFRELGIENVPKLSPNEELEFNLSSNTLTLRKVTLDDNYRTVNKEDIWKTTNWKSTLSLLKGFNIEGSFEDLLEDLKKKLKNPRSRNRIKGIFNSMVTVKSGEVGTAKGEGKEKALQAVNTLLEAEEKGVVSLYAGGFKPPHLAHFQNAKLLSSKADKLVIFIGPKIREGIRLTQDQSKEIWDIYTKYIDKPIEIVNSQISPIKDLYEYVGNNYEIYDRFITGDMEGDIEKKFSTFIKNPDKYSKVSLIKFPTIEAEEDSKFSATTIRNSIHYLLSGKWIPKELEMDDKKKVLAIARRNIPSEAEIQMQEALHTILEDLFPKRRKVKEGASGTAVAPHGVQRSEDRASLAEVYKFLLDNLDSEKYVVIFNNDNILIKNQQEGQRAGFDYTPYMASIIEHMLDEGLKITPLPEIKLRRDLEESSDFFCDTGYYNPTSKEIVLNALGRHPKDIMRSFAHEMIHHLQNLEGRIGHIKTTDTNNDSALRALEEEAYLKGNLLFRAWEDKEKKKNNDNTARTS